MLKPLKIDDEKSAKGKKTTRKRVVPTTSLILRIVVLGVLLLAGFSYVRSKQQQLNSTKSTVLGAQNSEDPSVHKLVDAITEEGKKNLTDLGGSVLGTATNTIQETLQSATQGISSTVISNTVSIIMGEIDKLPKEQKEEIKQNLCK